MAKIKKNILKKKEKIKTVAKIRSDKEVSEKNEQIARKVAMKLRREQESENFSELGKLVPLPSSNNNSYSLDRSSTLRLTNAYLKLRNVFPNGVGSQLRTTCMSENQPPSHISRELASHPIQAIDGFSFVFMVVPNGEISKITYISDTVLTLLGVSDVELTGDDLYDYVHPSDIDELRKVLNYVQSATTVSPLREYEIQRSFSLRMKCMLAKRMAGLTRNEYKVIHFSGYLKMRPSIPENGAGIPHFRNAVFVAIGHCLPTSGIAEMNLHDNMFMVRAYMDLKLFFSDAAAYRLTGYTLEDLSERTLYQFIHACDIEHMKEAHKNLLQKGQFITKYYRFLTKEGGWVWMQSYATVVQNHRTLKPLCIVSVNHVLSEIEYKNWMLLSPPPPTENTFSGNTPTRFMNIWQPVNQSAPSSSLAPSSNYLTSDNNQNQYIDSNAGSGYSNDYTTNSRMSPITTNPPTSMPSTNYSSVDDDVDDIFNLPYNELFNPSSTSASNDNCSYTIAHAMDGPQTLPISSQTNTIPQEFQPLQQYHPSYEYDPANYYYPDAS